MSKDGFIGYGRHFIDDDDCRAVEKVLRGDWLTQGETTTRFEAVLAERVGAKYAVAVSSGTAALHIAALAAGLGPGQWNLTSALTFVASANAGVYCGADSTLGDIDPHTLSMSPAAVERARREQPGIKTVIPVHYAGLSSGMEALRRACGDCVVIEDACHALGATEEDDVPVGACAHSDMAVFSFHPVKPITTGEGGAVTTNDKELYTRMMELRTHGIMRDHDRFEDPEQAMDGKDAAPWYYEQQNLGFNYRMTDIQAALGLSQMDKLETFTQRRRDIAGRYDEAFRGVAGMSLVQNTAAERKRSAHHIYVALFDFPALGCTRTQFMGKLKSQGIGTQVHYIPVYRQPFHKRRLGDVAANYPNTEAYYAQTLTLPLFPAMTDEDVERVIASVQNALGV